MRTYRTLSIGSIFGCSSMMFANYKIRFVVENGHYSVADIDSVHPLIRRMLNLASVCEDLSRNN